MPALVFVMQRVCLLVVVGPALALAYSAPRPFSSSSSEGPQYHAPFIRKQDMYGIWRLTHQNFRFPSKNVVAAAAVAAASSRPLLRPRYPMKEFTVYPKTQDQNSNQYVAESKDTLDPTTPSNVEDEIVLRLNDDGSFDPYTTLDVDGDDYNVKRSNESVSHDLQKVLGRGGAWDFRDGRIILAADRPPSTDADGLKVHDTLLTGQLNVQVSECLTSKDHSVLSDDAETVEGKTQDVQQANDTTRSPESSNVEKPPSQPPEVDVHLSIPKGNVSIGKFMYPRKHTAFFDDPMLFSESSVGTFSMKQLLGNLNARLRQEADDEESQALQREKRKKYHKKDFYGRRFYLTATPHPINPQYAAEDKHFDEKAHRTKITVMPIEFLSNNTFTAQGAEKILRGRYGTTGENGDRLWFQVTLFGFGRKKGNVYSEGRLLSHDDRRGYLGKIQEYQQPVQDDAKDGNDETMDGTIDISAGKNQTRFHVEGEFYYGSLQAGKANSFGTFTMQEIVDKDNEMEDDEEDEEDRRRDNFLSRLEHLMTDNEGDDENAFQ